MEILTSLSLIFHCIPTPFQLQTRIADTFWLHGAVAILSLPYASVRQKRPFQCKLHETVGAHEISVT